MGTIMETRDPNATARPRRIETIPRYMGCLVIRKGPETAKYIGVS
jgi:hypothetical protein